MSQGPYHGVDTMKSEKKLVETNSSLKNTEHRIEVTRRQSLESSFFEGARGLKPKAQRVPSSRAAASKADAK